jgi:hypothetical protein
VSISFKFLPVLGTNQQRQLPGYIFNTMFLIFLFLVANADIGQICTLIYIIVAKADQSPDYNGLMGLIN